MLSVFLVAIVVSFLQFTAVNYARAGQASLDLPLITLVFFSLRRGLKIGALLGFFFGSCRGIFSTGVFWPHLILYPSLGFIIGSIGRWFYRDSLLVYIATLFCALAIVRFFNTNANLFSEFLPTAAYNIVFSIFLFYAFRRAGA